MNATPYPDVNALLSELMQNVQAILGPHFVGMYLEGSLASGAFDQGSDIDFVVVTDHDIPENLFLELRAMHDRIATLDSPWAIQLEGSYIARQALRRYLPGPPEQYLYLNIERGPGEHLKIADHGEGWVIHRAILRERGITLAGPPPRTLIDPVSPADLRQAVLSMLHGWAVPLLQKPAIFEGQGAQSYMVLTLCRMLYTLHHGTVASKLAAARWAQKTLDKEWGPLIERALAGRHHPEVATPVEDLEGTLKFILYAVERSQDFS